MPICIECRNPIASLYTTYAAADDRTLGKGVRLTQCPQCKRFADKYVEHDFVVLFIDLVLIKPQVYRHLLFNRLGESSTSNSGNGSSTESKDTKPDSSSTGAGFDPSIVRLGILLLLFDVYLTWARIERAMSLSTDLSSPSIPPPPSSPNSNDDSPADLTAALSATSAPSTSPFLTHQPLLLQYLFFLLHCALTTLAFHVPIRLMTSASALRGALPAAVQAWLPGPYPHPNRTSTALLVSSCTKLFPILMVIWEYDLPSSATAVSWAVIINNIAALEILLDCGYLKAALVCAVGALGRALVSWSVLSAVGLSGVGDGFEMGGLAGLWRGIGVG